MKVMISKIIYEILIKQLIYKNYDIFFKKLIN
jgi:hypothetical protein